MRSGEWEEFFSKISNTLTVSRLARTPHEKAEKNCQSVSSELPVFDAIALLENYECLVLPDGRIVHRKSLLKRPLRIIFFILLTELESKLYRTQEWGGKELKELNETNMNDLIRNLINDEKLFSYQSEYNKRSEFKEDLKAISSIRNLVAHVNKKLELETDFETIVKRKRQMQKLLSALAQILDEQEKVKTNAKN